MRTLALALFAACAGAAWAASDQVPGTEATDRGNPEATGRGGDVLTPGTERDMQDKRLTPENVRDSGEGYTPKKKPTGLILAGLLAGAVGLAIGRRRRHRGRGRPSDDYYGGGGPPTGPRV